MQGWSGYRPEDALLLARTELDERRAEAAEARLAGTLAHASLRRRIMGWLGRQLIRAGRAIEDADGRASPAPTSFDRDRSVA